MTKKQSIVGFHHSSCTAKEYVHSATGIEFVLIPTGSFQMGSNNGENGEKTSHEVKVDSFLLAKYQVTNKLYLAFVNQVNKHFPEWMEEGSEYNIETGSDDHYTIMGLTDENNPVVGVSWDNAQTFCNHYGFSLPTEAQWEYACRAGSSKNYYWGDTVNGDYFWYRDNSNGTTHKVGQKKPNVFGLHDMTGNVWEWCADWYDSPTDNTTGPRKGRVNRGGSWSSSASYCRSMDRGWDWPDVRCIYLGFRPCFSI